MPALWSRRDRDHAHGRLPVVLRLPGLQPDPQAEAGRLLRLLLLRRRAVPIGAGGGQCRWLRTARAGRSIGLWVERLFLATHRDNPQHGTPLMTETSHTGHCGYMSVCFGISNRTLRDDARKGQL